MIVKALLNIRHDGKLYEEGITFEVDKTSGEKLIKEKAVEFISENSEEKSLKEMTVSELREYAEKIGLELQTTKKEAILQEITDYESSMEKE